MSLITFSRGDLKRKADQQDILQELVFGADTTSLCDIEVVTLKQHLRDKATNAAWDDASVNLLTVEQVIRDKLQHEYSYSKEFVDITPNKIKIGVDADSVTDNVVDRALALLIQVDDITQESMTEFGEMRRIYETKN